MNPLAGRLRNARNVMRTSAAPMTATWSVRGRGVAVDLPAPGVPPAMPGAGALELRSRGWGARGSPVSFRLLSEGPTILAALRGIFRGVEPRQDGMAADSAVMSRQEGRCPPAW